MTSILLISISLAMDAFSVSIAEGMRSKAVKIVQAIKVAAFFGIFQAIMPVFGWLIGEAMKSFITAVDHWIAFVLLGGIGINMIRGALNSEKQQVRILNTQTLLLLSIATSIDALIVGITLSLLKIPFVLSVVIIGSVTFILSLLGFLFGKQIGGLFGKKMEIIGGVLLILIGLKILIEHLII